MKRFQVATAASALLLALLAVAPPAHADQSLTFNVDLSSPSCAATPSGGSLSLVPGEVLTVTVVATGTYPDSRRCRVFLIAQSGFLTGWSFVGADGDSFPAVFGQVIPGAGTFAESATVGTASANIRMASFVNPYVNGSLILTSGSPVALNVARTPSSPSQVGAGVIVLPPVKYTLGFNANGGTCDLTNSGPIIDGVWIQVPTAEQCTRPGFTLLGWNPKPDGSDPLGFDPGGFTVMTDDNTLYAIWVQAT